MSDVIEQKKTITDEIIERLTVEINERKQALTWMLEHKHRFDALPFPVSYYCGQWDFDNLTHDQILMVMKAFPAGDWVKRLNDNATVDYEAVFNGMKFRCWRGDPPPNCQIVEEIVVVPATTTTRRKLVCK